MKGKYEDRIRLQHILNAIDEIESYLINIQFADFMQHSVIRFACIKQLEIIGEACNRVTPETQQKFPSIAWAQIIGMRNVFIHEYFGIDFNIAWDIINYDLPELKLNILKIIDLI